jgi:carboxymethylenebutenolidase
MTTEPIDPALDPELDRLSRRRFLKGISTTAVAATVLGPDALAQLKPGAALADKGVVCENVSFESGAQRVNAFLARPRKKGRHPSVIVIHEIFGVTDHIKDIAARLALAGYNGIAVDYFTREGKPPETTGDFRPLMEFVGKIPDSQIMADTKAAIAYLKTRPDTTPRVGTVSFCWGGRNAMLASAHVHELQAAVGYYGRLRVNPPTETMPNGPLDLVDRMTVPLMAHFGASDTSIPVADVDTFREDLKKRGRKAEIYVYEGAGHAFNNDTRPSYNAEAASQAWKRTLQWFGKHLK